LPDITLINTLDNKVIVKTEGGGAAASAAAAAPAPAAPAQPAIPERYRRGAPQPPVRPTAPKPATAADAPAPPPVLSISGEGEWKPSGVGDYEVTIPDAGGKPQKLEARIDDDELTLSRGPLKLIFYRAQ
jgi:hypothetical protein